MASAKKYGEREALRDIWGGEGRYWNENVPVRPNGLREKAETEISETEISCRGPGATRKKRYISSREEEDAATHMRPCGATIESRAHIVGECEIYKEERDVLGGDEESRRMRYGRVW